MNDSARVLNRGAGPLDAGLMFIGEAPGRLGADASELPFHGDKAGHNFEELLSVAGLTRASVFVTNAVLCNPRDDHGNNAMPTRAEVEACSAFMRAQIELLQPKIVVTLGATALNAVALIERHGLTLRDSVRTAHRWYGRLLVPLYHPGQRAMLHRSFANQRSDYQFVAERLARFGSAKKSISGRARGDVAAVVAFILGHQPGVSYFALHKLLFLAEVAHAKMFGRRLTHAYFVRQKDGPYCVDLHPQRLKRALPGLDVRSRAGILRLYLRNSDLFTAEHVGILDRDASGVVDEVMNKYGSLPEAELKTRVYLSAPMRRMLRAEKSGANLYNAPIELV